MNRPRVPDSGCGVVALGKLLRGRLGTKTELSTQKVRKVDQNGRNGKTRDSEPADELELV